MESLDKQDKKGYYVPMKDMLILVFAFVVLHLFVIGSTVISMLIVTGEASVKAIIAPNNMLVITLVAYYSLPFLVWAFRKTDE